MSRKKRNQIKNLVVDALELPKDLMYGAVLLHVTGQQEMILENYRGILEYTLTCICVQTKNCRVRILGKNLKIAYYTEEEMKITGLIEKILYE